MNDNINDHDTNNQDENDTTINDTSSENKAWKVAKALVGGTLSVLGSAIALAIYAKAIKDGKVPEDPYEDKLKCGKWKVSKKKD